MTTEIPKILIKFAYKYIEEDDEQDSIELITLWGRGSCYQILKTVLKSVGFGSCHSKNGSFGAPGTTRRRRWSRPARLAPTLGIYSAIPFTLPARTSGPPSHSRINASDFLFVAPNLPVPLLIFLKMFLLSKASLFNNFCMSTTAEFLSFLFLLFSLDMPHYPSLPFDVAFCSLEIYQTTYHF